MIDVLWEMIKRNRRGERVGIPSVCSSQAEVIRASLLRAQALDQPIVIEATSNQVNQYGGYTGMAPREFLTFVRTLAKAASVDSDRIIFGGDHLGPQLWRHKTADIAMSKAHTLVQEYVKAGFTKIHLDCSEGCAGESTQLGNDLTAKRSAQLASTCVEVSQDLLFVVGTEVPPPGGIRAHEESEVVATTPQDAKATLKAHMQTMSDMSSMIGGLVVQPGLEFAPMQVHHLATNNDPQLINAIAEYPNVCLEAHSTDYQYPQVFPRLAEWGFAFQKVGPALTFAYRQALYSLDIIRQLRYRQTSSLMTVMEAIMLKHPEAWQGHYQGNKDQLYVQRHFGLADRIRYYWHNNEAKMAIQQLLNEVSAIIPDAVLLQVFDAKVLERAEALTGTQTQRLICAQIQLALDPYFFNAHLEDR